MNAFESRTPKKGLRAITVIHENRLFEVEENEDRWRGRYFRITESYPKSGNIRQLSWADRMGGTYIGEAKTVAEAKKKIRTHAERYSPEKKHEEPAPVYPVHLLPGGANKDFYPTPKDLAGRMIAKVNWKDVSFILEPSAGKGDLIKAVKAFAEQKRYQERSNYATSYDLKTQPQECFDVIEKDENLMLMLRGAGLRLVAEDFLSFETERRYDLIMMNPPFSEGAKHLLHAIKLQEHGGQIVCLLNAETIRNPYTRERQELRKELAEHCASIEFVKGAFKKAERKTDVEIAIVYLSIPAKTTPSYFFENAQKAVAFSRKAYGAEIPSYLVVSDDVEAMISYYNAECKAGVDFLLAYNALSPIILDGKGEYAKPLIKVSVHGREYETVGNALINQYLEGVRLKYWSMFLHRPALQKLMTHEMANDYEHRIRDMAKYEFSRFNVAQVLYDIQSQLVSGVEKAILDLFETFTRYSMDDTKAVHYYNGWKTNKCWKIGDRAIIPGYGLFNNYTWAQNKGKLDDRGVYGFFNDIERSLHFLEKGEPITHWDLMGEIKAANLKGQTTLDLTYFTARLYKKGTAHIRFNKEAMPLIERLNIFAAQKRGWLPPSYGKKQYSDMDDEEKAVIDSFQGEERYAEVMANPSNFILEPGKMQPLLTSA